MRRSRLLLISVIAFLLALLAFMPIAWSAQNISASSISELNGLYTGGSTGYYAALADGDVCFVFTGSSDRGFIMYVYDSDSGQTEDDNKYIQPDYSSAGVAYTGSARWVKMKLLGDLLSAGGLTPDTALEVSSITAPQVRITHTDGVDDMDISVDSNGDADVQISGDNLVFQNDTDGTTGFQILDADGGTPVVNVDTTNERVGIGTADPNTKLDVNGTISADGLDVDGNQIIRNLTANGVLYANDSQQVKSTTAGSDGQVLVSNEGSTAPDWEYIPKQNLLTNTQWMACFNADTAKGLGEVEYDNPNDITPTIGEEFTGGTSSATGVLIEYDTNTLVLGRCAGRFHDNERIVGGTSDFGADINMPNSAAGVDLIQNGEFSVDTDPPPGWTSGNSATLSTEGAGKVGNCLMVTCNGTDNPGAREDKTVTGGKNYYILCYIKAGTEATYRIIIQDKTNGYASIYSSPALEETAVDWSTSFAQYLTVPIDCVEIRIILRQQAAAGAGTTIYFDEVSCYEVTPGCTGADNLAFDGWYKDTTLDVYRQHNDGGTLTHDGSFYSGKFVPSTADDFYYFPNTTRRALAEWTQQFAGRTVTVGVGCLTSTASHAFVQLIDSDTTDYDQSSDASSYHTGGGAWEWLEKTMTVSASTTEFSVAFVFDQSAGVTYFTQPMLSYGSSIGPWNYVPEADKRIYAEKKVDSQTLDNKTGANGFSDVSATELCIESDSLACIGKGLKAFMFFSLCNDSGSAGTETYLYFRKSSLVGNTYYNHLGGMANDQYRRHTGWVVCDDNGNPDYTIEASGGSTFDITDAGYIGIEWR